MEAAALTVPDGQLAARPARERHRSDPGPLCPCRRGGHGLQSGVLAGAGRTSASGADRGRVVRTSALASSGGLGCIRVLRAAVLSVPVPRVPVCPEQAVDLLGGGMGSLVRHLPGRDLARRVVLEARPRDPTPADRRRRQQWRHPIHLLPGRPTAMIAAIYAHKSTGYGGPTVLNSEPIAP